MKDARLFVKNGMLIVMFICRFIIELYGDLKMELNNDFAKWVDDWPANIDGAMQSLHGY